jgi:hypothetical protein
MSWADVMYVRGLDAGVLDSTARHVLLVVATHANRMGRAWPSIKTLAVETELHRSTVSRALERIETASLVQVIHRPGSTSQIRFPHLCHPDAYLCFSATGVCSRATGVCSSATRKQLETAIETSEGANGAVEKPVTLLVPEHQIVGGWHAIKVSRSEAASMNEPATIADCPYCDDHGWLWHNGHAGRCSHRPIRAITDITVDDILSVEQDRV